MPDFFYGRGMVSLSEPVLSTLHTLLLNYSSIEARLHTLVNDNAYSERASKMQFFMLCPSRLIKHNAGYFYT
jgi:hypothetical protein